MKMILTQCDVDAVLGTGRETRPSVLQRIKKIRETNVQPKRDGTEGFFMGTVLIQGDVDELLKGDSG
ncbi:MAG: hypothetical protein WCJ37_10090 [Syntrophus sp. (in: bacteria)]